MNKIKLLVGGTPFNRSILFLVALVAFVLMSHLPVGAAKVAINKNVRDKTPETLGIPADGVPAHGVKPYKADRAKMKERAKAVWGKNPVAVKVRGKAAEETETDQAVKFKNGSIEFEVSKTTGAEILIDLDRYTKREPPKRDVDEKTLEREARQYVKEQMPDVDLNELSFKGVKKIIDSVSKVAKDSTVTETTTEIANYILIFQRKVNKVPVVGPGEQVRVYLSNNGEIIGHSKIWRELDQAPKGKKPVVPHSKIMQGLEQKLAKSEAPDVEVDLLEFGYMGQGRYTKQAELRPVYLVGYKAGEESKRIIEVYDAYTGEEIAPPVDPTGADAR